MPCEKNANVFQTAQVSVSKQFAGWFGCVAVVKTYCQNDEDWIFFVPMVSCSPCAE